MKHTWNDFMTTCKMGGHTWPSVVKCVKKSKEEMMREWALEDQVPIEAFDRVKERTVELRECLESMKEASSNFYHQAIHVNNHTFVEFTGLINEYIKVCQEAFERGIDFTASSRHTEQGPLKMTSFQVAYVQEKLKCIYGDQVWQKSATSTIQPSPLTDEEMAVWKDD